MRSKSPTMYWQAVYISSLFKPKRHLHLDINRFYNVFNDLNAHAGDDEADVNFPDVNIPNNLDVLWSLVKAH